MVWRRPREAAPASPPSSPPSWAKRGLPLCVSDPRRCCCCAYAARSGEQSTERADMCGCVAVSVAVVNNRFSDACVNVWLCGIYACVLRRDSRVLSTSICAQAMCTVKCDPSCVTFSRLKRAWLSTPIHANAAHRYTRFMDRFTRATRGEMGARSAAGIGTNKLYLHHRCVDRGVVTRRHRGVIAAEYRDSEQV